MAMTFWNLANQLEKSQLNVLSIQNIVIGIQATQNKVRLE